MSKVVIAGGCGSGKTKLVNFLADKGFVVVPEVVSLLGVEGLSPVEPDFYEQVFERQLALESRFDSDGFIFLDRSVIDLLGLIYARSLFHPSFTSNIPQALTDYLSDGIDFSLVFFIDAVINDPISRFIVLQNKDDYASFARRAFYFKSFDGEPVVISDYVGQERSISFPRHGFYDFYILPHGTTNELYAVLSDLL